MEPDGGPATWLLFHSLAIHQGVDNSSGDRVRLAGSFRYQRVSDPVDATALTVHLGVLTWEEVYADWPHDDPVRYYWQSLPLSIQPARSRKRSSDPE